MQLFRDTRKDHLHVMYIQFLNSPTLSGRVQGEREKRDRISGFTKRVKSFSMREYPWKKGISFANPEAYYYNGIGRFFQDAQSVWASFAVPHMFYPKLLLPMEEI
ncbi:hypothetical protein [Pelodictyon phaeoclathratiforme]|jgi:hypothetical protein|uniref:hypothetical protein n=1 Tax=Pelodictyon phaeoclathratiforme TaxID=34090 RepID=UPI0005A2BA3D|nr:hypothetical protein [Pelodictyon phaeoclathratiforme]MBV5289936.1 hypothetical protein [Pelodictyon phaeoclathratiforme]